MVVSLFLKNAAFIIFVHMVFVAPVLFFSDGFFLRRTEFSDKSTEHGSPSYKRAIILLIDALSYSFVDKDASPANDTEYFRNKLTIFDELHKSNISDKVRLYKFIADPPTTTMQRIKALSTGSLSTFIELAANFFSYEIQEDSWIYQSQVTGNGVVALGDDTWNGLFPNGFKRTHLYPSFNVKDLDTVDNGVLDHLYGELDTRDWSVVLAHFLGVDHCGHTFGRNHPEMSRKLKQMDTVIRKTISKMDDDTILFVLGDHGMTPNGDHGGESDLEVSSALFVYAPKHTFSSTGNEFTAFQTDFIPSISLLMGWPIPFSSVGSLIEDLFDSSSHELLKAYQSNSRQLKIYLDKYFGDKVDAKFSRLEELYRASISQGESALKCLAAQTENCSTIAEAAISGHRAFHKAVRANCEAAWVQFNMPLVFGGLCGMAFAIVIILVVFLNIEDITLAQILLSILLLVIPLAGKVLIADSLVSVLVLNLTLLVMFGFFVAKLRSRFLVNFSNILSFKSELIFCLPLVPLLIGRFSNSFVIYDASIILPLLSLFVVSRTGLIISKILYAQSGKMFNALISDPINMLGIYSLCLLLVLRMELMFVSCREEHGPNCEQSTFLTPLGSLMTNYSSYLSMRFLISIGAIITVPIYLRRLAKNRGNLAGTSFTTWLYKNGLILMIACIVFDWVLQAASMKSNRLLEIPPSVQCWFPRLVYFLVFVSFGAFAINPLIFGVKTEADLVADYLESNNEIGEDGQLDPSNPAVMRTLYQFVKTKYEQFIDPSIPNLYVYGLGSAVSAGWQFIYASCFLLVCMLCGDGITPAIAGLCVCLFLFYKLEMSNGVSIAVTLFLVQNFAFYVTGHHATWTHIKWQAAFVGFDAVPDFFAIPGALILTNTFAGNVITILSIPFFVLWPVVEMNCLPKSSDTNEKANGKEGAKTTGKSAECGFIDRPKMLASPLLKVSTMLVILSAIEIFVSALAACVLRRHLMAFKIFVPRLIFSIISFFFNIPLFLAVVCIPLYILKRLSSWNASVER